VKLPFQNATPAAILRRGVALGNKVPSLLAPIPADAVAIIPGSESP
jgi:hypothetical protein